MKSIKLLTPICTLPVLATAIVPLTSCNNPKTEHWITDENFKPKTPQFESDNWYHAQEATEQYFQYAQQHPGFLEEEYADYFLKIVFAKAKQKIIDTPGATDIQSNIKVHVIDEKIEERIYDGIKHYFLSADFEYEYMISYHLNDPVLQYHINTDTVRSRHKIKTLDFCLKFGGVNWIASDQSLSTVHGGFDWEMWIEKKITHRYQVIWKESGWVQNDDLQVEEDLKRHVSNETTIFPDQMLFNCWHFRKVKAYRSLEVETNHVEQIEDPIIGKPDDIPMGADYETDITFPNSNPADWTVAGIEMDGDNVPEKYWTFTHDNNKGHLHIDGLDDQGKPVIPYDATIHMTYTPPGKE